jgi:uncharacterized membrane protein
LSLARTKLLARRFKAVHGTVSLLSQEQENVTLFLNGGAAWIAAAALVIHRTGSAALLARSAKGVIASGAPA